MNKLLLLILLPSILSADNPPKVNPPKNLVTAVKVLKPTDKHLQAHLQKQAVKPKDTDTSLKDSSVKEFSFSVRDEKTLFEGDILKVVDIVAPDTDVQIVINVSKTPRKYS